VSGLSLTDFSLIYFFTATFKFSTGDKTMKLRQLVLAASVVAAAASSALVSTAAFAQAKEQFFPVLPYRTGVMTLTVCHGPTAMPTTSS
jgi:hypothetical protein